MSEVRKGFNWLAFLFTTAYYGGKGKVTKGLVMALFAWFPPFLVIIGIYCGFKANKEIDNEGFDWPKAIGVSVFQMVIGSIMFNIFKK